MWRGSLEKGREMTYVTAVILASAIATYGGSAFAAEDESTGTSIQDLLGYCREYTSWVGNRFDGDAIDLAKGELPPLKWSSLRYGFAMKEDNNGEEETYGRRDRFEAASG